MGARRLSVLAGRAARVAVAGSLALAACGGSGGHATPSPPAATPPSFSAQANELCLLAAAHEAALAPTRVATLRDLARYAAAAVPVARGFARALGRLQAPASEARLWHEYLTRLGAQIDAEERAGQSAAGGDRAGIRRAAAAVRADDPTPLASRLRLAQCARTGRLSGAATASPV
jgi:hypothetical protein